MELDVALAVTLVVELASHWGWVGCADLVRGEFSGGMVQFWGTVLVVPWGKGSWLGWGSCGGGLPWESCWEMSWSRAVAMVGLMLSASLCWEGGRGGDGGRRSESTRSETFTFLSASSVG